MNHFIVWYIVAAIPIAVVVVVVATIYSIAEPIGIQARQIGESLADSYRHTAPLSELRTTIDHAVTIIGGLERGRRALGG